MRAIDRRENRAEEAPRKERPTGMGAGFYLPRATLTNDEIASWRVALSEGKYLTSEGIADKIGVERRHIAGPGETVSFMAFKAAVASLGDDRSVDLIISSTSHPTPYHLSSDIGRRLGVKDASVMDVHAACSGAAMAFAYIHEHREELAGKKVLVVATEILSDTVVDLKRKDAMTLDKSLGQTIFGDGAAAISFRVGEGLTTNLAVSKELPTSDGSRDLIAMALGNNLFVEPYIGHPVSCLPHSRDFPKGYFAQDGPVVYNAVQSSIPGVVREAVIDAGLTPAEIDLVVMHPGSKRMVEALRRRLKEFKVHAEYADGNMSSASLLYSMVDAIQKGLVGRGSKIVLSGFGAGSPHLFSSTVVATLG